MAFSSSAPTAVVPSPSPPPRPALAPRQPRSRLALVAADILMCLCFASSWISFAGFATAAVEKRMCGNNCPVVLTALIVYAAAALFSGLTLLAFMLLLSNSDTKAEKELPPRMVFGHTLMVGTIVLGAFVLLVVVGVLMMMGTPPGKRSCAGRIGSVMFDVGGLGIEFAVWFIIFPTVALSMRRMSREEAAQAEIKL
ncbi:unnamed protein product [Urochloa humidicola]